jgi:ribonuclease-3
LSVTGQGPRESNERLEFLGDSVLGLVTSEFLYRAHPTEHEGQLTKTKSLLVSKAILSRRALAMGLGRFVLMSHSEVESGGRQRLSILADAFEAVVGAIYLDQGFDAARGFIQRWLLADARAIEADKRHTNYKSHLQEYVQSTFRTHPVYRIRSEAGPDHSKHFLVEVMVGRRTLGSGKGRNKKEAEQAAARDALDRVDTGGRSARSPEGRTRLPQAADPDRERPERERPERAWPERERPERGRSERTRAEVPPVAAPPAPAVADIEADDDDESAHGRRRGRRGGRGRRREGGPDAVLPTPGRPPARVAPPPPEPEPIAHEVEPRPPAYEEDENEEIGRPEGPLEERHVDPFGYESEEEPPVEIPDAPVIRESREPDVMTPRRSEFSHATPAPEPEEWPEPVEPEAVEQEEGESEIESEPRPGPTRETPPAPEPPPVAWGRRGRRGR